MADPGITDELTQDVKDAQARFDAGMGADGDASPYPMLAELRANAAVHPGWPEMGIFENPEEGQQNYTAYSFDAVKAIFTDNQTFSTLLRGDRPAVAGADHSGDAGTGASGLPQAA